MRFPVSLLAVALALYAAPAAAPKLEIYAFHLPDIQGKMQSLDQYKGKVMLIVNVASNSSFTPQYAALETLYEKHKADGLVVLGFPANDFGSEEPDSEQKINEFCTSKYHVTFPLFSKVAVRGDDMTPLFSYLTKEANPKLKGDVHWNFSKFLISRDGKLLARFSPDVAPDDPDLLVAVEDALHSTGKEKSNSPPQPDSPARGGDDRRPDGV